MYATPRMQKIPYDHVRYMVSKFSTLSSDSQSSVMLAMNTSFSSS